MDKILNLFIKEPVREFHVREVAKLTDKSPTTVSKYLSALEKKKFLVSQRKFRHLFFRADADSPVFRDRKLCVNIAALRASGLFDFLETEFRHPQCIVLFGSWRKAENIPRSDIDLLIVTPVKKDVSLGSFEKRLGSRIQLFVHFPGEINWLREKNKDLVNNRVNGIVLSGFWELLS